MVDEGLGAFVEEVCGTGHLRIEADLGDGFVRLGSAEAERRQAAHDIRSTEDIVIELLRNARDAQARNIFLAVGREGARRRLVMVDDGQGVPLALHERVFEPRVTSKLDSAHMDKWGIHGRGMALYSISVNAVDAHIACSEPGKGSSFVVETDLARLGEKADQSSFPLFERTESGSIALRGPKNVLRSACEFALECARACTVYLGSPIEMAATLYAFGLSSLTSALRIFCSDAAELALPKRLALAANPSELAEQAGAIGLLLSERSARRIMDGEISPCAPLVDRIRIPDEKSRPPRRRPAAAASDARGLRIAGEDLEAFSRQVSSAFSELARDYYLEASVQPDIRVDKDGIRIRIPVEKLR